MTHCAHKVKDPKTKRMRYCRNPKPKGKTKCKRHNLAFTYSDESIEIKKSSREVTKPRKKPVMYYTDEGHQPAEVTYGGGPKKKTVRVKKS